jgi:hypothetical protein
MDGKNLPEEQNSAPQTLQPGVTVSPGTSVTTPPAPAATTNVPAQPETAPTSAPEVTTPDAPAPQSKAPASVDVPSAPAEQPAAQPSYAVEAPAPDQQAPEHDYNSGPASQPTGGSIAWTASELIAHSKTPGWYGTLFAAAVVIAALVWFFTKDIFSSVIVVLALGVLAAYASRTPRELEYAVDEEGLMIGQKHYDYASFKSFSIIPEGHFSSIELMPLKRFSPPITIYYDPADEDAIAGALASHLPFEHHKRDAIDQLMRRIRF